MPTMNTIRPTAAMLVSADVRRDVVWKIDPGASHGELSTRHWLWGHRAVPLAATSGHLLRNADELLELNLTVQVVAANDVVVAMEFVGAEFTRKDYGRLTLPGISELKESAPTWSFSSTTSADHRPVTRLRAGSER